MKEIPPRRRPRPVTGVLIAALVLGACSGALPGHDERALQSELRVQLARAYLDEERLAVALTEIRRGLDYNPRNPEAHQVMGLIQQRLGNPGAARRSMREALVLDPDNPQYTAQYATLLCRQGEYGEALALFERVNRDPLNEAPAATHARSGGCRLRAGDLDGATRDFRRALALQPEIPAVFYSMADIEYRRQRFSEAQAWLERYFAVAPETPGSLRLGVRIGRALGEHATANEYRRRLRAAWPYSAQLRDLEHDDSDGGKQ